MIANRNINLELRAYKCEYWVPPRYDDDGDRRSAIVLAANETDAGLLIAQSLKGTPAKWESHPYLIAEIHGVSPSVKKSLYLVLKNDFEGDSRIDKAKRLRG